MKQGLKGCFYFFYLTTTLVFFLYYLFPENTVKERLQLETEKMLPEMDLLVGRARPSLLPPGLQIVPAVLSYQKLEMVRFDTLKISPRLSALPDDGVSRCTFKAAGYGGSFSGSFKSPGSETSGIAALEGSFSGLRLEQISAINKHFPYKTTGALKGAASFKIDSDLKGDLNLVMTKVEVEFETAITGVEVLQFAKSKAAVSVKGKRIRITGCDMKGKQLDLFLTGRIYVGISSENSILDLSGYVRPHTEFLKKLRKKIPESFISLKKASAGGFHFTITGTVDRPNFFWN